MKRLTHLTFVRRGTILLGVLALVVVVLVLLVRREWGSMDSGLSTVSPADSSDDSVLAAVEKLRDASLRDSHDPSIVQAIEICRRAKDPAALPALVDCVTFVAAAKDTGTIVFFPGSHLRTSGESNPAVAALIEFGEAAVPAIIAAFAEGVGPASQREYLLLSSLGAILGPHKGVKRLGDAIAKAQTPEKQENLRAALKAFREFQVVERWLPEGEEQPFEGNIYEELKSEKGSTP